MEDFVCNMVVPERVSDGCKGKIWTISANRITSSWILRLTCQENQINQLKLKINQKWSEISIKIYDNFWSFFCFWKRNKFAFIRLNLFVWEIRMNQIDNVTWQKIKS